jgi:hemerythrin superfamily protein
MDRVYTDDQINKEVLQLLLEMDPETNVKEDVYDRAINKFILMETEHLNEEDEQVFPELRKNMNEQELATLEDNLRIAKQVAPTRPHPRAPVVGAKVLQPIVGVLDRTVDAVLGRQIIE